MEEYRHIRPSRILVVAGEARRSSRGTVKPLMPGRGPTGKLRPKPVVRVKGRRMLYCITLRPLFFRASTPQARIETVLHELFHISPQFDGTLDNTRRHEKLGRAFGRELRPLVRRYLKLCPPELYTSFAFDGDVRVQQWLERPANVLLKGKKVRRVYTEEQLFFGTVRMITRRTKAAKRAKPKVKLH